MGQLLSFMPTSKEKKEEIIKDLKEKIKEQKSIVFVKIKDYKTKDLEALKKELKQQECSFLVTKKTLLNIALKEMKMDSVPFQTQFGLAFSFKDEVVPAKIVQKKATNKNILGGFLENELKSKEEMVALAKLPSKDMLLQQLVGSISSPISGFLNVLQGNIKGLMCVLSSIKK